MRIDSLQLRSFRNYGEVNVDFDPRCNVIFGQNAQGKTNLLEAVAYLSNGKSPRAKGDKEMINFSADGARIAGKVFSREREFFLEAEFFRSQRRKIRVNQVPAQNAGALSQVFHTVFFCPEDLLLIREGAAARRKFMDTALCQLRPRYAAALAAYHRAYEQKTRILRDSEEHPGLLDALPEFNERMVVLGAVLIHYRSRFAQRLAEYAAAHHRECSGGKEELDIRYETVSGVEDPMAAEDVLAQQLRCHMESHARAELASRLCLSRTDKDDLAVAINGQDARTYASQGQTRTAALAIKLAEREIYRNAAGEYPVLLLDDVLSELDPRRQEFVLNRIDGGQVLITCCEDDRLPAMLGGKVLHVCAGALV